MTEIQLANHKALESKQQQNSLTETDDSIDWFGPSAPPMGEATETSPHGQFNGTSEQQVTTATVHATDDSTSLNPSQQETESLEPEERVPFLNVMAEGNDIHIGQITQTLTTSPRKGVTWG